MLKDKTIYDNLPESARVYLMYLPDRAVPRAVIAVLEKELHKRVSGLKLIVAGSYRRNRATSNDADIVTLKVGDPVDKITTSLIGSKKVEMLKVYAAGPDKASILFQIRVKGTAKSKYIVKSDLFMAEPKEYMYMLLYATGSGGFNIIMRARAKRLGLLLNQRGLYKAGVALELKNEHEIFERLGMTYREPEKRQI